MYEALGDLSLDLLRAFEAAARHRSFTAAAMELGTTQPAISQQIKRLEEQLTIRLFDRIYRGIELTDAPAFSFQGHPEASPGPHDVAPLFDRFVQSMGPGR